MVGLTLAGLVALCRASAQAQTTGVLNCFGNFDFGTMSPGATPGTITLRPNGTRAVTGGVSSVGNVGFVPPNCAVSGSDQAQLRIVTPSVNISNGAQNMVVDDFDIGATGAGPTYIITGSSADVNIGATLNVGANQASGSYSGTFTVMLELQ